MTTTSQYATLLVPTLAQINHCWRIVKAPDDTLAAMSDASYLQFLAEEMLRLGAVGIAVDRHSSLFGSVERFPHVLRERVRLVDKRSRSVAKVRAVLAPILAEFGFSLTAPPIVIKSPSEELEPIRMTVQMLAQHLRHFVVGLDYQTQVDADVSEMLMAVDALMEIARHPDARANLATLRGILKTYSAEVVESLEMRSVAPDELIRVFTHFVEDETYRQLSSQSRFLGFPRFLAHSMRRIGRLVRKLIEKPAFREIADVGTKVISTATSAPTPDSKLAVALLRKRYLPPVVKLDN